MIDSILAEYISEAVHTHFGLAEEGVFLEIPGNPEHGDFSTNIAFKLAKPLKKAPAAIAIEISELLNQTHLNDGISFTPLNGFINLTLSDRALFALLAQPFSSYPIQSRKVNLEFVSANPTGPLHIGHGRWAVMGSAIASLLSEVGHDVTCEFYINDAGNQIDNFRASISAVKNNSPIPENGYHGAYIKELASSDLDPVAAMLADHKTVLAALGVAFDIWYSESSLHASGLVKEMIQKIEENNLSYKADGALWFKTTEFGDSKDRVLIKADGALTYFCVDIAYHFEKTKREYDQLIDIWGADHHGYVPRMRAALRGICGDDYAGDRFKVIIGQLVSLFRNGEPVRMSKRTGEMITLSEVMEEIGVDATRFFLIQKSHDTSIDFDLAVAASQTSENPVYYIQYAHARIASILRKADDTIPSTMDDAAGPLEPSERDLLIMILRYRREILTSATNYLPHQLATYLIQLSKAFHAFYHNCPILNSEPGIKKRRLAILSTTQKTLKMGLHLLGISAPDSM